MNWPVLSPASTAGVCLLKWSVLLALGWMAHWLIRNRHSRWRVILWRGTLCSGLVFILAPSFPAPKFSLAAPIVDTPAALPSDFPASPARALPPSIQFTPAPAPPKASILLPKPAPALDPRAPKSRAISHIFFALWILGGLFGAVRLIRFQAQLSRLRKTASPAEPALDELARKIQAKLGVRRHIGIRISDAIGSPFICGPLRPVILLPKALAEMLPSSEMSALLGHEIAHFRHGDLFWCVAWRWAQAVFWFHPLVWKIPAAHDLACEEEADRMVCAQFADRGSYAQWLAQLALRALALPNVGQGLALNGAAQIVRRLNHLARGRMGAWKWSYSALGIVVLGLVSLLISGSTDEPVYHFRTVTQWLDRMSMFDELRAMDAQDTHDYTLASQPNVVTNDPALRAMMAIGPKAVPALEKILREPPDKSAIQESPDPVQRVKSWVWQTWRKASGHESDFAPPPLRYSSIQMARMAAAGLAMLALGTNSHAGALRLIEIGVSLENQGYATYEISDSFRVASAGLPERRHEMIAGIMSGLNSTNPQVQLVACQMTMPFGANLPEWKSKLMRIARGPDVAVSFPGFPLQPDTCASEWALWSLACAGRNDPEITDLCARAMQDKTRPPRLRSFAAGGLGLAGERAEFALPLLRAVLTEQGILKGWGLTGEAHRAIEAIEKAVATRHPGTNSVAKRN